MQAASVTRPRKPRTVGTAAARSAASRSVSAGGQHQRVRWRARRTAAGRQLGPGHGVLPGRGVRRRERQAVPTTGARDPRRPPGAGRVRSGGRASRGGPAVQAEVPGRPGLASRTPVLGGVRLTFARDEHGGLQLVGGRLAGGRGRPRPGADLAQHRPAVDQRDVAAAPAPGRRAAPTAAAGGAASLRTTSRSPPAWRAPSTARAHVVAASRRTARRRGGRRPSRPARGPRVRAAVRIEGRREEAAHHRLNGRSGAVDLGEHAVVRVRARRRTRSGRSARPAPAGPTSPVPSRPSRPVPVGASLGVWPMTPEPNSAVAPAGLDERPDPDLDAPPRARPARRLR